MRSSLLILDLNDGDLSFYMLKVIPCERIISEI